MKTAILLINLGTPKSYQPKDVKTYLTEFLTDPRVIDVPFLARQFLVRGVIIPKRYKESAASYKEVWTKEGSPLLVYGNRVKNKLQNLVGDSYHVSLAMRYQKPSIASEIEKLIDFDEIIVVPLFPQYASATTGSIYVEVMNVLSRYQVIPQVRFVGQFASHPAFLDAFAAKGRQYDFSNYDHILFSYHGLPQKQILKADRTGTCLTENCCEKNPNCYSAQCHRTTEGIVERLGIQNYSICFQSRLGKDPWLEPYASEVIEKLAKQGCRKILAFCPSFVCDCLETTFEFGVEYQKEFQAAGGESLDLVEGLNDDDRWIEALSEIVFARKEVCA